MDAGRLDSASFNRLMSGQDALDLTIIKPRIDPKRVAKVNKLKGAVKEAFNGVTVPTVPGSKLPDGVSPEIVNRALSYMIPQVEGGFRAAKKLKNIK